MIYRDAHLTLGGTNLSAYLESVEPNFDVELTDDTTMGDTARSNEPGLKNDTMTARFKSPFTDNGPDETIWALMGTTFSVVFKPNGSSTSASNPSYTQTMTVASWNPVAGSVGDQAIGTLTLAPAGGAGTTRATV